MRIKRALLAALFFGSIEGAVEVSGHSRAPPETSRRLLRSQTVYHETSLRRRMEDGGDDDGYEQGEEQYTGDDDDAVYSFQQGASDTFVDMFVTSPSTWTPLEWGIFFLLLLVFGICFFCVCLCCIVPQCCGHRAAMAYVAMT